LIRFIGFDLKKNILKEKENIGKKKKEKKSKGKKFGFFESFA